MSKSVLRLIKLVFINKARITALGNYFQSVMITKRVYNKNKTLGAIKWLSMRRESSRDACVSNV